MLGPAAGSVTVDACESRASEANGFGEQPPGEGEVGWSGKGPPPALPQSSVTQAEGSPACLVFSGGGAVSFDRRHTSSGPQLPSMDPVTL